MDMTYDKVGKMYADHNYRFYDGGKLNINLFGIRKDLTVDLFNDLIGVAYRDHDNNPQLKLYTATTDPGRYWLKNKLGNINGTFILKPGHYRKCWVAGKHKGLYEALVQMGAGIFKGWRDNDSDGDLDINGPLYTDVMGLNLHTTSHLRGMVEKVGGYSAGCQVIKYTSDHFELMGIVKKSQALFGEYFSYTLFNYVANSN